MPSHISPEKNLKKIYEIIKKIEKLKEEKNALILAHNYQNTDIQKIADFKGDSLELAIKATKTDADLIVFCGVDFMAETVSILNPDKKVVVPCKEAKCPMALQLTPEMVKTAKKSGYPFIAYVNTHAEVKAEADVCCTSANADKIAKRIAKDGICYMGPDANLAAFASKGVKVIPIPKHGYCYVHKMFQVEDVVIAKKNYPDAEVIVHPECDVEVQNMADFVGSTSQMLEYVKKSDSKMFIVGTEIGLIERMRIETDKKIVPLRKSVCIEMKLNTIDGVLRALSMEENIVKVDEEIAKRAKKAIKKMFDVMSIVV